MVANNRNSPRTERTAVYRFFDAEDQLLYIGITCQLARRISSHELEKTWWGEVARISVEHHPTRGGALAVESAAIQLERPRFNIIGAA